MKWELKTVIVITLAAICFVPHGFLFSLFVVCHFVADMIARKNKMFYYEWHQKDLFEGIMYHTFIVNLILAAAIFIIGLIFAACTGELV
jgi:preprotein translocase subunit SecY